MINITSHSTFGGLTAATLGNSLAESRTYTKRGWLGSIAAGSAYSLTNMNYAGNGNVGGATDSVNGNWGYFYDGVNRLQTATVSGHTLSYNPDEWGNMWCSDSGGWSCTPLHGSQLNQHMNFNIGTNQIWDDGDGVYQYDAAGNLLQDGTHGYVYDAENRLTCVKGSDGTCTSYNAMLYLYDGQGQRVGKQQADTLEDYVYDPQGHIISVHDGSANLLRSELYSPDGRHVSTWEGNTWSTSNLFWNHADWLGTERVRTNSSGVVVQSFTDTPYGMNFASDSSADVSPMHFTGKQRDYESGLDYFGARFFGGGNSLGRFMIPDPLGQDAAEPGNPQSWNMYAYAGNNPTTNVDPDGEDCINTSDQTSSSVIVSVASGTCNGSGAYVAGTIDMSSLTYNGTSVGYSYTPYNTDVAFGTGNLNIGRAPDTGDINPFGVAVINAVGQQANGMYGLMGGFAGASLLGGVGNALGLAAAPGAGLISLGVADLPITADEVAFTAVATVGNQSIQVASRDVAEEAAEKFVGPNAEPIRGGYGSGPQVGWKSADGTKVARWTSADTKGYINLENKATGGNLHVRW